MEEPRARKPVLTGQASNALNACGSAHGEFTPTPYTGPNSWPMIVVTPEAREASGVRAAKALWPVGFDKTIYRLKWYDKQTYIDMFGVPR